MENKKQIRYGVVYEVPNPLTKKIEEQRSILHLNNPIESIPDQEKYWAFPSGYKIVSVRKLEDFEVIF